jgi:HlyD family secretion protein
VKRRTRVTRNAGRALLAILVLTGCEREDPNTLVLLGTLERDRIALATPVQETVLERPVHEGDHIKAGTVVARMDDTRLKAEVSIYVAARARAQAQLAQLEAGTTKERLAQADAEREGAIATAASAKAELNRVQKLFKEKLVPQSELDRAQAASDEADARKRRADQVLEELRRGARVEELDAARAELAEAEARIREAQTRLDQLELRTPVDAVVDELLFGVGERPAVGAVVALLVADSTPYARVFVPERAVSQLRSEHPAQVLVDGVEGPLEAHFQYIATDSMFTPYYALTDRERDRLVFRSKVLVTDPKGKDLRSGVPVQVLVRLAGTTGQASSRSAATP